MDAQGNDEPTFVVGDGQVPEWLAELRREQEEREAAERPLRRVLLEALAAHTGTPLDIDAALDCRHGCHPRIELLHRDGQVCDCQLTDAERAERRQAALDELFALTADMPDLTAEDTAAVAAAAQRLGVSAQVRVFGAPFVVSGVCDGRAFYLRERHGLYAVAMAAVDDPELDLWRARPGEVEEVQVASGAEEDLFGPDGRQDAGRALEVAVTAVRDWLRVARCAHEERRDEAHLFCSRCGLRLG